MNLLKIQIPLLRRLDILLVFLGQHSDYRKFNGGKSNKQGCIDFSDATIGVSEN